MALIQLFNHELIWLLNRLGLPIHLDSGADRIMDAGFGARRRIEWTKAWEVFKANPWFGVGLGGFGSQSVWMEAYLGLPKVPESWLFTQSHNLIFQLLAETGLVGTSVVVIGLIACTGPYFRKSEQTVDNLLLVSIAMMILGHSMFEYPLWYLPFLTALVLICSLSPAKSYALNLRPGFLRGVSLLVGVACLAYVFTGIGNFWTLVHYSGPTNDAGKTRAGWKRSSLLAATLYGQWKLMVCWLTISTRVEISWR
ncbi:PglL family O-oligosaccharyltransferase [Paludibacterium denitrificans]|uniref:PglL family O-oligosaccharyltransferase n=1 Tax=Paludibacterium denitrificans TaxID=2675226 RepID=UPI0028A59F7D|nr:Wzy polymerase domain-containing protein [Paludibacterium denitrificans]